MFLVEEAVMTKKSAKKSSVQKSRKPLSDKSIYKGIVKQYLKSSPECRVTFKLPRDAAPEARSVTIVGDFNDWNFNKTHMKKLKNGDFKLSLKLSCKREYKFKYLVDGMYWKNDWCADKYVPNPYGHDDSVVIV
jgi:1,4-alpha-glucan branching enzyme